MGHVHIRHYGGIVCFSCRQFFRRAHQQSKQPNFVCNKDGGCLVSCHIRFQLFDPCIFNFNRSFPIKNVSHCIEFLLWDVASQQRSLGPRYSLKLKNKNIFLLKLRLVVGFGKNLQSKHVAQKDIFSSICEPRKFFSFTLLHKTDDIYDKI